MKATAFILLSALLVVALGLPRSFPHDIVTFPDLKGSSVKVDTSPLHVHLIPHSHDDVGWLKTLDQYFYGAGKPITRDGVQYILDTVTRVLENNSTKEFVYVEIAFFKRWWQQQTPTVQAKITQLVKNNQLEFVNGGYVMNDEAAVYYEDCIEQMSLGHSFLLDTFGVTPTSGWHLDPFGHASAQSALFAQMGFTAFFIGRIDYQDKINRTNSHNMEALWIPNTSQGTENALLLHILYNRYSNPDTFCFDLLCEDEPIMDDSRLEGYNVNERANALAAWFRGMQSAYQSDTLLHTAGDDFMYSSASVTFKNYDKLFAYMNANANQYNITVNYSTPAKYLEEVAKLNLTYPTKVDDFFPYADYVNAYWGGYFTSRVAFKGLVRKQGQFLQATRRLVSQLAWENSSNYVQTNYDSIAAAIGELEEALAIGQHHDAVTGTSKQAVVEDYKRYFANGKTAVLNTVLKPIMSERAQTDLNISNLNFVTCQLNSTANTCSVTYTNLNANLSVLLAIYNSGTTRSTNIRVKVPNYANVTVQGTDRLNLTTDIICSNVNDPTDCDLFFTSTLSGFNVTYFYLIPGDTSNIRVGTPVVLGQKYAINALQTIIPNGFNAFTLQACLDASGANCTTQAFNLNYNYYPSYQGDGQKSGAYIFRPTNETINGSISYSTLNNATVYQGLNMLQLTLGGPNILANVRIYGDLVNGIEVQTYVDSINVADGQGKEVVLNVKVPSLNNSGVFYTDSMGMELQQRVFNFRPSWTLNVSQPAAGNYYPVQSTILINDTTGNSLAVIPDRAQGGASLANGEVELMIHRRLIVDDSRGVDEPLNETDADGNGMRQWITHTIAITLPGFVAPSYRTIQLNRDVIDLVALTQANVTIPPNVTRQPIKDGFGGFDPAVKLISRTLGLNRFIFRFQNTDDVSPRNVSTNVFTNTKLGTADVLETSLTANQDKESMIASRYDWNGLGLNNPDFAKKDYKTDPTFLLRPLEIRTFVVTFPASKASSEEKVEVVTV